jgi:hypothetical protein
MFLAIPKYLDWLIFSLRCKKTPAYYNPVKLLHFLKNFMLNFNVSCNTPKQDQSWNAFKWETR